MLVARGFPQDSMRAPRPRRRGPGGRGRGRQRFALMCRVEHQLNPLFPNFQVEQWSDSGAAFSCYMMDLKNRYVFRSAFLGNNASNP